MELRVLRYFLAVAQEETISGAADALHVTQPTLSRQMMELEEELGKTLFTRGKRKILLTAEGLFLRKRAREIVALADQTQAEFSMAEKNISGNVSLAGGETHAMRFIARAAQSLQAEHPHISYQLFSGNAEDVTERLDKGVADFGLFIEPANLSKYDYIKLPVKDTWGVLMRKDSPLAKKSAITPSDFAGIPVLLSRQTLVENSISGWMGDGYNSMNCIATYNLLYNAAIMVEEGLGYALCLDNIIGTGKSTSLCFRPLAPLLEVNVHLAWKKYQIFTKAAEKFLEYTQKEISNHKA